MKNSGYRLFLSTLVVGLVVSVSALAQDDTAAKDYIISFDGDAESIVAKIQSLGGEVKRQYRNVTAMAVTLPPGQIAALQSFPGVAKVEKDGRIRLSRRSGQ